MVRIFFVLLLEFAVTVLFAVAFTGAFFWAQGVGAMQSFSIDAPAFVADTMLVAFAIFALLLVIGGIRKRGLGFGVWATILAAIIAALVNAVWILARTSGVAIPSLDTVLVALEAGGIFLLAAALATIGVRRVIKIRSS